uniref:Endonuclease G, mitochondrial n=1 Tax=Strigamia maritima TaxID=126957 RepID=T1JNF5_STRMM
MFRLLYVATAGIGGCFCGSVLEKWRNNSFKVHAGNVPAPIHLPQIIPPEPPSNANNITHVMRFGFPGHDNIRSFDDFVLSYDRRNRAAHWVLEHLTPDKIKQNDNVNRELCRFSEDQSVHPFFRAQNQDYFKTGFDRGHLAAARNHHMNQNACEQTFVLSNISPQIGPGFNRDAWNKLEKHVRNVTKYAYKNVYVCTGPLYLPRREGDGKLYVKYQVIGLNHVAVPTHFFKVIVGETKDGFFDAECYVMPNAVIDESLKLSSFQVPIESVERSAGLLLFDKIPREKFRMINHRKTTFI